MHELREGHTVVVRAKKYHISDRKDSTNEKSFHPDLFIHCTAICDFRYVVS